MDAGGDVHVALCPRGIADEWVAAGRTGYERAVLVVSLAAGVICGGPKHAVASYQVLATYRRKRVVGVYQHTDKREEAGLASGFHDYRCGLAGENGAIDAKYGLQIVDVVVGSWVQQGVKAAGIGVLGQCSQFSAGWLARHEQRLQLARVGCHRHWRERLTLGQIRNGYLVHYAAAATSVGVGAHNTYREGSQGGRTYGYR